METPKNFKNIEGGGMPQWDRAIPPGAQPEVPVQRGATEPEQNLNSSDIHTYHLPQTEVADDTTPNKSRKGSMRARVGVGLAAVVITAGAGGAGWYFGGKNNAAETAHTPSFDPLPPVSASEVPGPASGLPSTETVAPTPETAPAALFTLGPKNEKVTVEKAKQLGQISASEVSSPLNGGEVYLKKVLETGANMNVSPEAKYSQGKVSAILETNKEIIKGGLFAGIGSKHNVVSKVDLDDYIEPGTLMSRINQTNLANNTYAVFRFGGNPQIRGDLEKGVTILADLIVDYKNVLVDSDDGTKTYGANIVFKLDQATGTLKYDKTYFAKGR